MTPASAFRSTTARHDCAPSALTGCPCRSGTRVRLRSAASRPPSVRSAIHAATVRRAWARAHRASCPDWARGLPILAGDARAARPRRSPRRGCGPRACAGSRRRGARPSSRRGRAAPRCRCSAAPARRAPGSRARARSGWRGSAVFRDAVLAAARGRRARAGGARRSPPPAERPVAAAPRGRGEGPRRRRRPRARARARRDSRAPPRGPPRASTRRRSGGRKARPHRAVSPPRRRRASASRRALRSASRSPALLGELEHGLGRLCHALGATLEPGGLGSRRRDRPKSHELSRSLRQLERLVERRPLSRVSAPRPQAPERHERADAGGAQAVVGENQGRGLGGLAPAPLDRAPPPHAPRSETVASHPGRARCSTRSPRWRRTRRGRAHEYARRREPR